MTPINAIKNLLGMVDFNHSDRRIEDDAIVTEPDCELISHGMSVVEIDALMAP